MVSKDMVVREHYVETNQKKLEVGGRMLSKEMEGFFLFCFVFSSLSAKYMFSLREISNKKKKIVLK